MLLEFMVYLHIYAYMIPKINIKRSRSIDICVVPFDRALLKNRWYVSSTILHIVYHISHPASHIALLVSQYLFSRCYLPYVVTTVHRGETHISYSARRNIIHRISRLHIHVWSKTDEPLHGGNGSRKSASAFC